MTDEQINENVEMPTEQKTENVKPVKSKTKTSKPKNEKVKVSGRPKMSKAEKEKRTEQLKNEPKNVKFSRLANVRVRKAVKSIGSIGYLASNLYEHNDEQVKNIEKILNDAVVNTMAQFKNVKTDIEIKI